MSATGSPGLGRASRVMAAGTLVSRVTGFLRSLALAYVLGFQLVPAAYNAANTLPNMVYELLLGGILTSVFVPLLVKAQRHDADGGEAYAQRLLSLAVAGLAAATAIAVLAAPLLIWAQGFDPEDRATHALAVALARLLLVEIFFYGLGAAIGAILNTRGHFAAPMWAPVMNNLVVLVTCGVFLALPGPARLTPDTITLTQVLVLGIGTTLGIAVQALVLLPMLRRVGFRWKWRLDWRNARLGEFAGVAAWVIAYVAVSQLGVVVVQRLAVLVQQDRPEVPGLATFVNAQLLFMLPHGIVAVSLITALLPRMSRSAVDRRWSEVARDLSFGTRLTAVALVPMTAVFVVLGPALGTVLYSYGRSSVSDGRAVGAALTAGALGLLPFAVSQMQIFAFYALRDTRTPALVNVAVVAVKIVVDVALYSTLPAGQVVNGLMWGNTASYVVAVAVSGLLLSRRLGGLDGPRVRRTVVRLTAAAVVGGLVAWALATALARVLGIGALPAVAQVAAGCLLGGAVFLLIALRLQVSEVRQAIGSIRHRFAPTRSS